MGNQVVNREVNIYIKSGEAQKALDALLKKQTAFKEELKKATDPKEVERLNLALKKLEEPIERAQKKLSGELEPSLRDVQAAARRVNNEFARMSEGDEGFDKMRHQFHQANRELDAQKEKMGMLHHAMKGFWAEAKMMATGMLMANGVMSLLDMIKEGFMKMAFGSQQVSDEFSDIEKTTGLTTAQVQKLNAELLKMDTRTSESGLRKLAEEAGKLGEESAADVKKFVDQADKIKVALGEDLGENAIIDIAKTSKIFQVEMLNIASAINEIGQSSEASEAFSVDFLKRMAGTAPTVKLAADQVLGYSAALEIAGQTSEVSSTALNTFFLDFVGNVEKFGKAAGFAKGELTTILNTQGTNEAFLQFLQRLKESQPTTANFINKMRELGIDGARGSNVMLALANNIKTVREQQEIANKAIKNAQSVLNEFNKKNQNGQAELEKLKKNWDSMFNSVSVQQAGTALIRTLNSLVNVLKAVPEFIKDNRYWMLTLAAGVLTLNKAYILSALATAKDTAAKVYNAAVTKASNVLTALSVAAQLAYGYAVEFVARRITFAAAAQRIWNTVMALGAGPIGLILVAVGALAIGIATLVRSTKQLTAEQQLQADISKKIAESSTETVETMRQLTEVAKDNNVSLEDRKKALNALIAIAPEYLKGLTLENLQTKEGIEIQEKYIAALRKKAEFEAKASLLSEKLRSRDSAFAALRSDGTGRFDNATDTQLAAYINSGAARGKANFRDYKENGVNFNEVARDLAQIAILQKSIDDANRENVAGIAQRNSDLAGGADQAVGLLEKLRQKLKDLQEQREKAADEKTIASLNKQIAETEKRIAELEGKSSKASRSANKAANDLKQLQEELERIAAELLPDGFQKELTQLDNKYNQLREKAHGNKKLLLEIERLYQIELQKLKDEFYIRSVKTDLTKDEKEKQRIEALLARAQGAVQRMRDNIEQGVTKGGRDRLAKLELDQLKASHKEKLEADLALLNEQERQELLKTDLTENEKALIQEKYRRKRLEAERNSFFGEMKAWMENVSAALNIVSIFDEAKTQRENADLERDRKINEKKKQNLEKRLKAGHISQLQYDREVQKLEKEQERREKEAKLKQFKRSQRMQVVQALMNGAMAITSTLAAIPGPLDIASLGAARIVQLGLMAVTTAAQVATISKQKPPEFGRGGRLVGPAHSDPSRGMPVSDPYTGRIHAFMEGGEGIANTRTMGDPNAYTVSGTPSQIISLLNGLHGGVQWHTGAVLRPGWDTKAAKRMNFDVINSSINKVRRFYASGGVFEGGAAQQSFTNDTPGLSSELLMIMKDLVATNQATQQTLAMIQKYGIDANVSLGTIRNAEAREAAILGDATARV